VTKSKGNVHVVTKSKGIMPLKVMSKAKAEALTRTFVVASWACSRNSRINQPCPASNAFCEVTTLSLAEGCPREVPHSAPPRTAPGRSRQEIFLSKKKTILTM